VPNTASYIILITLFWTVKDFEQGSLMFNLIRWSMMIWTSVLFILMLAEAQDYSIGNAIAQTIIVILICPPIVIAFYWAFSFTYLHLM
jgi:hypothetical protein